MRKNYLISLLALFAIGIVLFFFTFLCNLAAFLISQKYKLKASN